MGTADGQGRPHVVVVTFAVDGDMIYTAVDQKPKSGSTLKRLHNVGENPMVTMLADHYSDDWETLWWVRADGRAAQAQVAGAPVQPVHRSTVTASTGPGGGACRYCQ